MKNATPPEQCATSQCVDRCCDFVPWVHSATRRSFVGSSLRNKGKSWARKWPGIISVRARPQSGCSCAPPPSPQAPNPSVFSRGRSTIIPSPAHHTSTQVFDISGSAGDVLSHPAHVAPVATVPLTTTTERGRQARGSLTARKGSVAAAAATAAAAAGPGQPKERHTPALPERRGAWISLAIPT